MVRLHQRALFLIFRLERGARLAQILGAGSHFGGGAHGNAGSIGALGRDPARGRLGQCLVESDQRFTLQRIGIAGGLAVLAAAGVDDALRLGIGDQLPFGFLEIGAGLGNLPLEEIAGIGRRFIAPLQVGIDEAFGNLVGDCRRKLRGFRVEAELDQLALFRRLDIKAADNLAGGGIEARRRIAALPDERLVVGKIEILRRALSDAPARQQADLGRRHNPRC